MTSQTSAPEGLATGIKGLGWQGPHSALAFEESDFVSQLLAVANPLWAVSVAGRTALTGAGSLMTGEGDAALLAMAPAVPLESLGDPAFCATYGTR
ncbi:hypothetical protein FDZ74_10300, partial [bacterium]